MGWSKKTLENFSDHKKLLEPTLKVGDMIKITKDCKATDIRSDESTYSFSEGELLMVLESRRQVLWLRGNDCLPMVKRSDISFELHADK